MGDPMPTTRVIVGTLVILGLVGCSSDVTDQTTEVPSSPSPTASVDLSGPIAQLPPESRISDGGGEPRSSSYWISWSTCGEGSQAQVAEDNGGAAAGWFLLDDILADPRVSLGEHAVTGCEEGVDLLGTSPSDESSRVDRLAAEIMTAQVNLSAASESCVAVDATLAIGNTLLTTLRFEGAGRSLEPGPDVAEAIDETVVVLAAYNAGTLCE